MASHKNKIMTTEEMKVYDETVIVHAGYTRNQLKAAFERVQNPDNWKMPTKRIVVDTEEEAKVIVEAITFYTGGVTNYFTTFENRIMPTSPQFAIPATLGYYHHIGS